jgi:hypothetical protein
MTKNTAKPPCSAEATWAEGWITLADVIQHGPLQVRAKLNPGALRRYREMTQAGKTPPPIKVGRAPDGRLYLVDGWHRIEAGALQLCEDFSSSGLKVLALVANMTADDIRWAAASANLGHGVPLRPAEYRMVFKAYVKAGRHRHSEGRFKTYREMGAELGKGHTTVYNWMKRDFPRTFAQIGGGENGNSGAEQPRAEVLTFAEEHRREALKAAERARQALQAMTAEGRWEVYKALQGALEEAARLGLREPAEEPF